MAMLQLQEKKDLEPKKTWQRPIKEQKSTTAATAQTFYIDIPRDSFIHEIIIQVGEGLNSPGEDGLVDDLTDIKLVGNGNKYMKDSLGLAPFFIEVERMHMHRHVAGMYHLYFSDPQIPETKPLPAWLFTSLQLILIDNAPAATKFHFINVTLVESAYDRARDGELIDWKVLVEKVLVWKKFGTDTGEQVYDHERAYKIFSYIYAFDDNGALGDAVFDKIKVVGRNPQGEIIVHDFIFVSVLKAENNGQIVQDLDAGYAFLQFLKGFPTADFSTLQTRLNIKTAGANKAVRVLERYLL